MSALFKNISAQAVILQTDDPSGSGSAAALNAAASLLCLQPPEKGGFCGVCPACRKVLRRVHPDVLFFPRLDKKMTVGEAKNIVFESQKATVESAARVFIIDASASANAQQALLWQNILLKTLEEAPPENFYFLLIGAASELPQTVVSRCQVFDAGDMPGTDGSGAQTLEFYRQNAQKNLSLALRLLNVNSASDAMRVSAEITKNKEGAAPLFALTAALSRDAAAHNAGVSPSALVLPEFAAESRRLSRQLSATAGAEIIRLCEAAAEKLAQNVNFAAVTDELLMKITEVKHKCPIL